MSTNSVKNGPKLAVELAGMSGEEVKTFVKNIDTVIFDCDGVLWREDEPFENANALVILLRSMGKRVFFLTNNSAFTKKELMEKFTRMGFETKDEEILSAAYLTALYLKQLDFKRKAYVIGCPSIVEELSNFGIESLPVGPDPFPTSNEIWTAEEINNVELDSDVGAVVVAFDHHFSYVKALKAATYLNRRGPSGEECVFVITDLDELLADTSGRQLVVPGGAAMIAAVQSCVARNPTVIAKPDPFAFRLIQKQYDLDPKRALMIGDRGNTDILFGRNCGLWTLLTLSGFTSLTQLHTWEQAVSTQEAQYVPDYFTENVNEFYSKLNT